LGGEPCWDTQEDQQGDNGNGRCGLVTFRRVIMGGATSEFRSEENEQGSQHHKENKYAVLLISRETEVTDSVLRSTLSAAL
jgi:hypothetical protein